MITIVTRWENLQMPADLEWRMWRQLKGAFVKQSADMKFIFTPIDPEYSNTSIEQYDTMEEALENCTGNRVFLEHTGYNNLYDLPPRNEDVVFVLGNTQYSNLEHANVNETYRIATPKSTELYGINAAAIALAYWHGQ